MVCPLSPRNTNHDMNQDSEIEYPGIKVLQSIFNKLRRAINRRTIIIGSGLDKSETEGGVLFWATKQNQAAASWAIGTGPRGLAGSWQPSTVVYDACVKVPRSYRGTPRV